MARVGIVSFMHESNSFNETLTTRTIFERGALHVGRDIVREWGDAHHELGGMIEMLPKLGHTAEPLVAATAMPGGPVCRETYEEILGMIVDKVRSERVDGLLLSLHGAMIAEHLRDADGETASRVRAAAGSDIPIVLTLDLHANVSPRMLSKVTATTIYRSNPHLDQRERGREAARLVADILSGKTRPVQALEKPPLMLPILAQRTECEPALGLYHRLEQVLSKPGILTASIALGFPYADVAEMGCAFLVVADGDAALARHESRALARFAWNGRERFDIRGTTVADAVREARDARKTPVTLLDVGDNVGGGSPADGTLILHEILRSGVDRALVILYDPESARLCAAAGVGTLVSLEVGGKSDGRHGPPAAIRGRVRLLHDGRFYELLPRHGGKTRNDQGLTALIETDEGHSIVLNSLRTAPFSLEQVLSLGIRPERMRVIVAKGAIAPRAAYEPVSARLIEVASPGITSPDPEQFHFDHRRRPMFPFERDAEYPETDSQTGDDS